ncbi:MAG TPA: hypothetical protein DCX22_00255 [Dehalococcoidia bacterium]|nr:hypothetical protein [Dehalococcoidia bacterium]
MTIWSILIAIVCSYLLGAFPYMLLLAHSKGMNFTHEEDLHLATWQKIGRLYGLSAVVIDILKGVIPVIICGILQFPAFTIMLCGLAAVCGQMWPFFRKFNGEKGNTTGLGVFVGISIIYELPLFFFFGIIPLAIGSLVRTTPRFMERHQTMNERFKLGGPPSNGMPIGMLVTFICMPPLIGWLNGSLALVFGFIALFLLITIRRLTAGITDDIKTAKISVWRILFNRFLLDRSYWQ